MMSASSATAPLPQGLKDANNAGLKGGGGDNGRRACDDVGCQRHGAYPVGGEGPRGRRPQGRRRQQEGLQ